MTSSTKSCVGRMGIRPRRKLVMSIMIREQGQAPEKPWARLPHWIAVWAALAQPRVGVLLVLAFATPHLAAQQQEQHTEHHHGDIKPVQAHYPELGRAQSAATTPLITLEQVQKLARENNPTLRQ